MAELGFLGVVVYTRVHTPRRCGQEVRAGDLLLSISFSRPLRTNCEMVGIPGYSFRLIFSQLGVFRLILGNAKVPLCLYLPKPVKKIFQTGRLLGGRKPKNSEILRVRYWLVFNYLIIKHKK
jgi:hypothetical protein